MDGSQTWSVPVNLTLGAKYQVKVRVKDVYNWSAWSNIGWMQINSATSSDDDGAKWNASIANLLNTLRPTLQWSQTDPDPGTTFQYFQIQITNEANNVMILDRVSIGKERFDNWVVGQVNQDSASRAKVASTGQCF